MGNLFFNFLVLCFGIFIGLNLVDSKKIISGTNELKENDELFLKLIVNAIIKSEMEDDIDTINNEIDEEDTINNEIDEEDTINNEIDEEDTISTKTENKKDM